VDLAVSPGSASSAVGVQAIEKLGVGVGVAVGAGVGVAFGPDVGVGAGVAIGPGVGVGVGVAVGPGAGDGPVVGVEAGLLLGLPVTVGDVVPALGSGGDALALGGGYAEGAAPPEMPGAGAGDGSSVATAPP
jgi:hypothetical protein